MQCTVLIDPLALELWLQGTEIVGPKWVETYTLEILVK